MPSKLIREKDLEFIRKTAGSRAHKIRLLGHMIRIRSSPEFRAMERERKLAQKHMRWREQQRALQRMRLGEFTRDA